METRRVLLPAHAIKSVAAAPSLREQWVRECMRVLRTDGAWVGSRKVVTRATIELEGLGSDLALDHVGFTDKKRADLTRLYLHESRDFAATLWKGMRHAPLDKIKNAAFHCFAHLLKRSGGNASRDMGPCMNSMVVTRCKGGAVNVDVSYRSADLFRVFAADLVFMRDVLLAPFDLRGGFSVRVNLASATCHPRDFGFVLANVPDPHREMVRLRRDERRFHKAAVSALAAYLCEERAATNANYDRGKRVQRALVRLMDEETREILADHCRAFGGAS